MNFVIYFHHKSRRNDDHNCCGDVLFIMNSIINTSNMNIQSNSKSSKHFILLNLKQVKNIFILLYWICGQECTQVGESCCNLYNEQFIYLYDEFVSMVIIILISYKHESKTVIRPSTHRLANKYIINSISIILNFGNYITDKDYVSMFKCYVLQKKFFMSDFQIIIYRFIFFLCLYVYYCMNLMNIKHQFTQQLVIVTNLTSKHVKLHFN